MKRILLALVIWLAAFAPAYAQPVPSERDVLQGRPLLLDQIGVKPAAAYSLRLLTKNYWGPLVNLRRSGDNATLDFYPVDQPYPVVSAGAISAWINAGGGTQIGYVTEWYDQTGGGNHLVQATAANQPNIILSTAIMNGKPGLAFLLASSQFLTGPSLSVVQPYTVFMIVGRTNNFTSYGQVLGSFDQNAQILFLNAANTISGYAGVSGSPISITDSISHVIAFMFNGASSSVSIDTIAPTTVNLGTSPMNSVIYLGKNAGASHYLTAAFAEMILFSSGSVPFNLYQTNAKYYYGTP